MWKLGWYFFYNQFFHGLMLTSLSKMVHLSLVYQNLKISVFSLLVLLENTSDDRKTFVWKGFEYSDSLTSSFILKENVEGRYSCQRLCSKSSKISLLRHNVTTHLCGSVLPRWWYANPLLSHWGLRVRVKPNGNIPGALI